VGAISAAYRAVVREAAATERLDYRPLTPDDRPAWARLLAVSFGRSQLQMEELLDWFHAGFRLVTMGAWAGDRLVAQYNCRLLDLSVPGWSGPFPAGMGLNMAVDPAWRGRGLLQTVATPVHEEIARLGCLAGVGFSGVGGLAVTRASESYGYEVLGPMVSTATLLLPRRSSGADALELSSGWPAGRYTPSEPDDGLIRYAVTPAGLRHRFAEHPFRRYVIGAWRDGEEVRGLTVHRPVRLRGVPGLGLLEAYAADGELDALLHRWAATVAVRRPVVVHVVTSPSSRLRAAVRRLGPSTTVPFSQEPYHLIARALGDGVPPALFDLARWDATGGDIL
jgi:hypothetical protein